MTIGSPKTFIRKGCSVLFWPVAQLILLRWYLHHGLELRFGFANTTDFDFLLPVPVAFFFLFYALDSVKPLTLRLNRWGLLTNLVSLGLFIAFNQNYEAIALISPELVNQIWFGLLALVTFSAACLWLRPSDYLQNPNRLAFIPCLFIGSSLYLYQNAWRWLWLGFGEATSFAIQKIFQYFPSNSIVATFTPEEAVRLDHAALSVRIGRGCGGGDAVFFFVLVFALMILMNPKRAKKIHWMASFAVGLAWMFALNLLRIILLFFVGIALRKHLGVEVGTDLFKLIFHTHVGWLLYVAGIYLYLRIWDGVTKLLTVEKSWDLTPMDQSPTGA